MITTVHIAQQILDWSVITALTSLFSAGGVGGLIWKQVTHNKRQDNALLALLHFRLYANAEDCIARGHTTVAEIEDLESLYRAYKSLGGNGTGERLYKHAVELPVRKGAENEH
nr:MAG TPA: holin protein [Caudoviricetes sp.]